MHVTEAELKELAEWMIESHVDETSCNGCVREHEHRCTSDECYALEGWRKCPSCNVARKILA